MPNRYQIFLLSAIVVLSAREIAPAQIIPFYSSTGTAFTPEIDVVNTGVLNDAQVVVSADEKYVTLTMGATSAGLLALREFSFQGGNLPAQPANATAVGLGGPAPIEVTFLDRQGITRVD